MIDPDQKPDRSRILIHDINFIEIKSSNNDTERVHHLVFYSKIFFKLLFKNIFKTISRNNSEKRSIFFTKNNYKYLSN